MDGRDAPLRSRWGVLLSVMPGVSMAGGVEAETSKSLGGAATGANTTSDTCGGEGPIKENRLTFQEKRACIYDLGALDHRE